MTETQTGAPTDSEPRIRVLDWRLWVAGITVLLLPFLFLPPGSPALDHFDACRRVFLALVALLLIFMADPGHLARRAWTMAAASSFALWLVVRGLLAPNVWSGFDALITWLLPAVMFVAGLATASGKRSVWILRAFGAGALIQASIMLLQYVGVNPVPALASVVDNPSVWEMTGTVGTQEQAAAFIALAGGVAAFAVSPTRVPFVFLAATAVISVSGCLSVGLCFLIASFTAFAAWSTRVMEFPRVGIARMLWPSSLMCALVLGAFFLATPMRARLLGRPPSAPASPGRNNLRSQTNIAQDMLRERTTIGHGPGAWALQHPQRVCAGAEAGESLSTAADWASARETVGDAFRFSSEFGVIGIVLLLGWMIAVLSHLIAAGEDRLFATAGGIYIFAYVSAYAFVAPAWRAPHIGPPAAFLLGACVAACGKPQNAEHGLGRVTMWLGHVHRAVWRSLAVIVAIWALADAVLVTRIARIDDTGRATDLVGTLPPWTHRYRALLGDMLVRGERFEDALCALRLAEPGHWSPTLSRNIGACYEHFQQWDKAADTYRRWAETGIDAAEATDRLTAVLEHAAPSEREQDEPATLSAEMPPADSTNTFPIAAPPASETREEAE